MTFYLLNSPILTTYGKFTFEKIDVSQACEIIQKTIDQEGADAIVSAIGHESTARLLSQLLDHPIPANRIAITMTTGDQAVVIRLTQRLPEGKILGNEELKSIPFELGLLTCIEEWNSDENLR